MNFVKTFEARIADAFGAAPQGYTAPFSFKKLAKRAAKEMEAETFVIDGVDTAPGLFTVLVAPSDDAAMRPLYPRLTTEIVSFVEAQAAQKGYVFVAEPLARFMVDPSLKSGKFAVFAENVNYETLERLREEETVFLSGASAVGGAAADLATDEPVSSHRQHGMRATAVPVTPNAEISVQPIDGLDIIPSEFVSSDHSAPEVAPTQLRPEPHPAQDKGTADVAPAVSNATCILIDRKSGHTYKGSAPVTPVGRERIPDGVVLRDPNVSRRHAELTYDGHLWRICDLGSTNGTLVNDIDVTQCVLHDGDIITLGLTNLEFRGGA